MTVSFHRWHDNLWNPWQKSGTTFCKDCKPAEHLILTCNSYQPVLFLTMVSANIDRTIRSCLTLILHRRLILDTVVYGFEHENRSNVRGLAACRLQTALITYWGYMYLEALYYPSIDNLLIDRYLYCQLRLSMQSYCNSMNRAL